MRASKEKYCELMITNFSDPMEVIELTVKLENIPNKTKEDTINHLNEMFSRIVIKIRGDDFGA